MNDETPHRRALPSSKYEMNLAEFPIAVFSKKRPKDLTILQYEDTIRGKDGKLMPRSWKVKASVEYGFGSTELLSTLFELFQIWKEQGFESNIIQFGSEYNLIKRMGLENEKTAYTRLRTDLGALVEISIEAQNAFWDNEKQAYVDQIFHLFDSLHLYHRNTARGGQATLPFSYIKASETLWHSIESNAILTLRAMDRDLFYSLSPAEQRLTLYLAKMLRKKTLHFRDVRKLLTQLPILASTYHDGKKLLSRYCDSIINKGVPYLNDYHFEKKKNGGHTIFFRRDRRNPHLLPAAADSDTAAKHDYFVSLILEQTHDEHSRPFYTRAVQQLREDTIYRAIAETKVAAQMHDIRTTPAQYFTHLIKQYAKDDGVTL